MFFTKILMTIGEIFEKYGYPLDFKKVKTSGTLSNYIIWGNCQQDSNYSVQAVGTKTSNLWSGKTIGYLDNNGEIVNISSFLTSDYIEVEENAYYTAYMEMSENYSGNSVWFCFYDENKAIIGNRDGMYIPSTYAFDAQAPTGSKFMRVSMGNDLTKVTKQMVCVGQYTKDTVNYEPFGYKISVKNNGEIITNIYLDRPLYKVGEYADYVDYANKQVVRNVGVKTLDGSETDWDMDFYNDYFYTNDSTFANMSNDYTNVTILSDKFETKNYTDITTSLDNYCFAYYNQYYASVGFMNKTIKTVDDWKIYLNSNPITVYYPLATPASEIEDLPSLAIGTGLNVYTIDGLKPSNMYGKRVK